MKKKLFTLLELILVILLVALLLNAIRQIFTYKQRDWIKANWCVYNLVWKSENYFFSALTSKGIFTGGKLIFPTRYILVFSGQDQKVYLKYFSGNDTSGLTWTYYIFSLTWSDEDSQFWCYSPRYQVRLSGSMNVVMQPGLEWWAWKKWILIDWNEWKFTWQVYLKFYGYWYSWKILGKIRVDKRVDLLEYVPCLQRTGKIYCKKWAK